VAREVPFLQKKQVEIGLCARQFAHMNCFSNDSSVSHHKLFYLAETTVSTYELPVVTETVETKILKNGMLKLKNNAVCNRIPALSLCSNLRTVTIVSVTTGPYRKREIAFCSSHMTSQNLAYLTKSRIILGPSYVPCNMSTI
jgi:hypothetical protein